MQAGSLWEIMARSGEPIAGIFHGRTASIALRELAAASMLNGKLEALRGRSVVLASRDQLPTAAALVELDGVARRLVLCTPDLGHEQLTAVCGLAEADALLVDAAGAPQTPSLTVYRISDRPVGEAVQRRRSEATEWILLTSGTTGAPKLVVHSFESLAGALPRQPTSLRPMVWSTFYDIRRYGGLQIYLRAAISGSPL